MANNTWSSAGSTDGNLGTNYSLGALNATDDLIFDATSVVNVTFTANLSVTTITVAAAYTGAFNDGGFKLSTSGAQTYTGGGTITGTGEWEITGDADLVLNSGATYTVTDLDIDLQGTGNFQSSTGATLTFHKIIGGANTKTTTHNGSNTVRCVQWEVGAGTWSNGRQLEVRMTAANDLTLHATHTISGSAHIYYYSNAAATFDIPLFNGAGHTGRLVFWNATSNAATFNMQGAINNNNRIYMQQVAAGLTTFTTNNHNITCDDFYIGNVGSTTTSVYNFGSSALDIDNGGVIDQGFIAATMNMGSSTWTSRYNVTFTASSNVVAGTSTITFDGINDTQVLTCGGNTLGGIICNISGNGMLRLADALACTSLTITNGDFDQNTQTITSSGAIAFNGVGSADVIELDASITITGDANFTFGANVGTWTISTTLCDIDLQGTGNLQNNSGSTLYVHKIKGAANTKTTTHDGSNTLQSVQWELGAGTWVNNRYLQVRFTANGDVTLNASHTINGTAHLEFEAWADGITITIPTINANAHSGVVAFYNNNGAARTCTYNLDGVNNTGSIYTYTDGGNNITTYNYGSGAYVTVNHLYAGDNSGGNTTVNFESATFTIGADVMLNGTILGAAATFNMSTSTWDCRGEVFNVSALATINQGTCSISFTTAGAGVCVVTLNGESLYDVTINKSGNGVQLADAFVCTGTLTLTDGTFDMNGQTVSCAALTHNTADAATFDAALTCTGACTVNQLSTFNRLILTTGQTFTWGANITLNNYTLADWDGITIRSSAVGTQRTFTNPAAMTVSNVDVQDNSATNPITCTGTDSGNNVNWSFPGGAALRRSQLGSRLGLGL